jgi:hypothetical protein
MDNTMMETAAEQKVWDAWILKGKLRDKAAARKHKIVASIALVGVLLFDLIRLLESYKWIK